MNLYSDNLTGLKYNKVWPQELFEMRFDGKRENIVEDQVKRQNYLSIQLFQ